MVNKCLKLGFPLLIKLKKIMPQRVMGNGCREIVTHNFLGISFENWDFYIIFYVNYI